MFDAMMIGNVVRDPETRQAGQSTVCAFTVAINDRRSKKDDNATFVRVNAWNKLGELCQKYLVKGSKVAVRCDKVSADAYMSKDGTAKASIEMTAQDVEFLSVKGQTGQSDAVSAAPAPVEIADSDLPF